MEVPPLEDLPLYDSKAEAGVKLLKQVRKELVHSPRVREVNRLVDIARPLASDMKLLKPSLTREFNQYVPFKVSFTLTIVVFIVSTLLHLLFMMQKPSTSFMADSVIGNFTDGNTQLSSSMIDNVRSQLTGGKPLLAPNQIPPERELSSNY